MANMEDMDQPPEAKVGRNYGGFVVNFLTGVVLLATLGLAGVSAALIINPYTPANPFPPPTLPPTLGQPTAAPTLAPTTATSKSGPTTATSKSGPTTATSTLGPMTPSPTSEFVLLSDSTATPTRPTTAEATTILPTAPPNETPTPIVGARDSTSTPTPGPSNLVPNPNDPSCAEHDDREWHALHNPQNDCHYDHAHGMPEPGWAEEVFGSAISEVIWTVSYPWQTPNENLRKHAGYAMHAYDFRAETCYGVDAYTAQTHGVAIEEGKLSRLHSFALAASLCDPDDGSDAGLVFTGGHEDYGQLISPYKQNFASYPKFPGQEYRIGIPPYVGEMVPGSTSQKETWNSSHRRESRPHVTEHERASIAFRIRNAVDFVDPNTRLSGDPHFIVVNEPENNSSAYQLYQIEINVPDLNGDGSPVTGEFRTDRHGKLVDCSVLGTDCVPLILIDAVPGTYTLNATAVGLIASTHRPGSFFDHDIWFCGDQACPPHSRGAVPSGWIDLSSFGK